MPQSNNYSPDLIHSLNALVSAVAESLEVFTVAIYIKSNSDRSFRVVSHRTLSKHFLSETAVSTEKSRMAALFAKRSVTHETHARVPLLAQEIYSKPEPVLAMVVAPVLDHAALVVDTTELAAFQPGHIRFIQEIARAIEGILTMMRSSDGLDTTRSEFSSLAEMLNEYRLATDISDTFFDGLVSSLVSKGRFDGALIATVSLPNMDCRVRSVSGFSKSLNKGRIVKLRPGWAKWSIENVQSVIMGSPKPGEPFVPIFHVGEALGFPVKSAVVVPWTRGEGVDGFLLLASSKEDSLLEKDRFLWEFIGAIVAIVRRNVVNEKLLKAVRLYDGESGLMNESFFRFQTGTRFSQLAEERTPCLLVLVQIENIDSIYLEHDVARMKRFLTIFTERLLSLDKRKTMAGKFRTGGFGSFIENAPLDEATHIIQRVLGLFSLQTTHVDGVEIVHSVKVGWCHYPSESSGFEQMWKIAVARLSKNKPSGRNVYEWANL
ncbi:MAG: diguanylate cyclase [Pseudomonadota bacterium]